MEHIKRLSLLWLLLAAVPITAQQDEAAAFFSLSSERTYGPGETATVQLWGQNFDSLQFRLYRINDPVKFFEKLEDDHAFGGQVQRPERKLTTLERFRAWKLRQRASVRNLVRAQFTMDARREYVARRDADIAEKRRDNKPAVAEYAGIPVLNPQQLVATWTQPFRPVNRWESASVPVPTKGKGMYLVEANNGKLTAYTIVSVTDLAVITKGAPGRLFLRAVERESGKAAPATDVRVYGPASAQRATYATGKTDKNGYLEVKIKEEKPDSVLVLARRGEDFAALSQYGGNVATDEERVLQGYVYTDRPVYRPGHTVYYKAIVRAKQIKGYEVPNSRSAHIEVQDSEGKTIYKTDQSLSSMGTLNGKFPVPQSASLGFYSVQVKIGESFHHGGFQVEEYKKPEYEVRVIPAEKRVILGKQIQAQIEARYYYGEPVAGAKVTWVVHRSRYWLPYYMEDLDEGEMGNGDFDSPYSQKEQTEEKSGELDKDGKLTITVPTEEVDRDQRYRIEARVTDVAGREISGSGFAIATVGSYFIHVRSEQYVYAPGDTAGFIVETRDYDGKPVARAPFTVELLEWNWKDNQGTTIKAADGTTGADGTGRVSLPVKSGSLRARARSKTKEGKTVEDYEYIWVSGNTSWMRSGTDQRIQIVPDKKSYKAGDKAKVLIMAGDPDTELWVTVEGRAVLQSQFVTAKDGSATIDVPIEAAFAPNVFVTATALRNNKLLHGTKSIKVPPLEHKLTVDLKPSKPEFKPGEPATYSLEAKDNAGKPVSGAEFSVGVVDEAIYAVRPETTPDILTNFYGREWNTVNTETSLSYYFHGEAGRRRMQLARVRPFRVNAQLKPDKLVQPKVRKAFPDTAFWAAEVRTDSAGKAQVKLEFPDALTTWRATARGVTSDTKVGSATDKVIVRKNLLTRLAVPRFFRQGDTMTLTVITQNLLPNEKKARISLDAKGLEVVEGGVKEVSIPSKGTSTVDYKVKVPGGKEVVLLAKALTDEESDALELTLPIVPFGVKMTDPKGGSFTGPVAEAATELTFPKDAETASRAIELSVAPSAAGTVFDALDYLTAFPYGCTEQTMSSFLPNVVVSQAVKSLGLKGRVDEALLLKKVKAGFERLYDFQHEDGGWGWWKTDDSDVFMTAYVVAGLAQAKEAGYDIDQQRLQKGAEWLSQTAALPKQGLDLQAYAEYSLALAGLPARSLNGLYLQRDQMSTYGAALLGLALDARKDTKAAEVATHVETRVKQTETEARWESDRDTLMDLYLDATPEATAYAMKLIARQRPQSALLPKAALYLVNHRTGGYYWNSTKQTAMVIYGLTDYLKASGELKPNFSVTVFVNDQPALTKRFTEADASSPATIRLEPSQISNANNKVRVVRYGNGRVYWSARAEYYSNASKLANRGNLQLNIDREYFRLQPNERNGKIVYDLEALKYDGRQAQLKQGDVVAVRLTVTGNSWKYLLVEDPIPAGTEIVERDDLYEFAKKPDWWEYYFSRREFRDDRVAFFQTYFDTSKNYFYLLKVVNPGEFRVSPARVEPMYQPQYFATSDSINMGVVR